MFPYRQTLLFFVLSCSLSCSTQSNKRDYYNRHGELPEEDPPKTLQGGEVPSANPVRPPVVPRTTVVVNNGRTPTIASYWLRFPSENKILNEIGEFMIAQAAQREGAITVTNQDPLKTLCVDRAEDTDYVGFLFSHFAHAVSDPKVQFAQSSLSCAKSVPDFENYFPGSLHTSASDKPNFTCDDQLSNAVEVTEIAETPKKVKTSIQMPAAKSDLFRSFNLETFSLESGEQGQAVFLYSSDRAKLTLYPYQAIGEAIYGTLQLDTEEKFALRCKITH